MVTQFTIGFKPQRLWTSLAAIDFFLGGTGAGVFLVSMYLGLGAGGVAGLVGVALGALALLADLGRPERFWRAGSQVIMSWISRGVVLTLVFLVFGVLYVLPDWLAALPWSRGSGLGQGIGLIAALAAGGVMMYTGFLLSHSPSIPFWNTTLLPLLFVSSALTSGLGAVYILLPFVGDRAAGAARAEVLGIVFLAANLVVLAVYVLNMHFSTVGARESVRMLVRGSLASAFLGGVVVVGLVIPLVVTLVAYLGGRGFGTLPEVLAVEGILMLIGGYVFRHCVLKAGVYPPIM